MKTKKRLWLWIPLGILAVFLLLVLTACLFLWNKLDKIQYSDESRAIAVETEFEPDIPSAFPDQILSEAPETATLADTAEPFISAADTDKPVHPQESAMAPPEQPPETAAKESIEPPVEEILLPDPAAVPFDKDVFNILLLGTDERTDAFSDEARADSIMIASLHTRKNTIKLVSLERAIGVPVPDRPDDLLTHTFRYGGAQLTLQTVRDCFSLDIDRYVRINVHFFEKLIDTIGGIDLSLTQEEAQALNDFMDRVHGSKHHQHLTEGNNHMDGLHALHYSRLRFIDSDWQRIKRQRNVIQAIINQVQTLSILEYNDLADACLPLLQTNLTKTEIAKLLLKLPGFLKNNSQMENMTIPVPDTHWLGEAQDGRAVIRIDFVKNTQILHDFLYETPEP